MAADSSIDDTEAATPEDKAAPCDPPADPPRPPRPVRRTSGSLRIPLPSSISPGSKPSSKPNGAAHAEVARAEAARAGIVASSPVVPANSNSGLGELAAELATEDATATATPIPARRASTRPPAAVVTPAVADDASANYEFVLTRRSSAAPPMSFDSRDVDPSDRAPIAPLTPWRDVPPLNETAPEHASAARPTEEEREDTIVGAAPKNLLEMSSDAEEENTRAYQAPQELIELARRQREERRQVAAAALPAGRLFGTAPSPEEGEQCEVSTRTVPLDLLPQLDAAPPVARSRSERSGPAGDARRESGASLANLARAASERSARPGPLPAPNRVEGREPAPDSDEDSLAAFQTPWLTRGRLWLLLVVLFLALGFALARWGGLDRLLPR